TTLPYSTLFRSKVRGAMLGMLAGLALAVSCGCTRTDDGSVAVADPLRVGRYLQPPATGPQTPPIRSGAQIFPVPPGPDVRAASPRRAAAKKTAQVEQAESTEDGRLAGRNAVTGGGRVQLVW